MRVLVLEDDARLATAYTRRLRSEGMAVDEVRTLAETRRALIDTDYDCLVLDRFVPDGDSLELVAELDGQLPHPPVVLVSSAGGGDQRVDGLEAGADDYLAKPVRLAELALRVRRVTVRHSGIGACGRIRLGRVTLDPAHSAVTLDGEEVALTRIQYSVFEQMVAHRHRLVTIQELLDHCWDSRRDLFSNPLHSQITRLRKAFRGALGFKSVHSMGYVLEVRGPDPPRDEPST